MAAALELCPSSRSLDLTDLSAADVVLIATPDDQLTSVVDRLAAADAVPAERLVAHTSGVHGLEALAPLANAGVRVGGLHPVCPVPDSAGGARGLRGMPAVIVGDAGLEHLAERVGMTPVRLSGDVDRALYHAACALAANGVTALAGLTTSLFERCGAGDRSGSLVDALMRAALDNVERDGPAAALTGPVQRGDDAVVARHMAALDAHAGHALAAYAALMERAAHLAREGEHVTEGQVQAILQQLRGAGDD